ncbi:Thioredoxin-like protein [Cinnamomum micranthum f. kanehirae]|uniref:Thioredoxin-like protein n=1 Tax=Cinnamomum micranthum f. kanehirae TaxID=337451 RepID=A0A3S3Q412_9MAGN|nr:Thioredoxin-like protein [Cinnamomum micranthum f. kanehirae]
MEYLSPFRSITRRIVATTSKYTMPTPPILFGPPEIHPLPIPAPSQNHPLLFPSRKPPSILSPFLDAMTALFKIINNNLVLEEEAAVPRPKPLMWPMENVSPYFQSSGNPCLDLFNMLKYTPPETVRELLRRAWAHNPLTTLKLILHLRRPAFRFDKEVLYTVVFWLHQNHPKTLALNVRWFAQVGYMDRLLKILFREVARPDVLKIEKEERELLFPRPFNKKKFLCDTGWKRILAEKERLRPELARRAVEKYNSDSNYRFLYDKISDFAVESLKIDIWLLDSGEFRKISGRAAAWYPCPDLHSLLDYSTLLSESVAKRVFPRESDPSYAEMEEAHYSYIVRERLRKLLPLLRHRGFLPRYRIGEYKGPDGTRDLLPHEILSFLQGNYIDELRELQWKRMAKKLSKKRKLSNCLSVCDVSVSMDGTPMEVCVALGLLVSQLSEEPWRRNVINFSENPELHRIEGKRLLEKVEFIKRMQWGMNIDFQKVYDRILDVAVASKLEEEEMVKRVFVFSDMDFAEASGNSWETDYHTIQRKYEEKGYGSSVPEMVFWNLKNFDLSRRSIKPPVTGRENGVQLVSGFSNSLLNIFLDNGGVVNPEEVMEEAIAGEVYKKVSVFD